jgi:hypothetical protein
MQQESLIAEQPVTVGDHVITVVARIVIHCPQIKGTPSGFALKQPVYLLVSSKKGKRALSMDGMEISPQAVESALRNSALIK